MYELVAMQKCNCAIYDMEGSSPDDKNGLHCLHMPAHITMAEYTRISV